MDGAMLNNVLTVLQIVSILGGGFYFLWRVESKIQGLVGGHEMTQARLIKIDNQLEKVSDILIQLAKQEERMDAMDRRMQELSNRVNNGSVQPTRRRIKD